jgi:hypothetical protein
MHMVTMEDILRTLAALRAPYRRLGEVELVLMSHAQREDYNRRVIEARGYLLRVILAVQTMSDRAARGVSVEHCRR